MAIGESAAQVSPAVGAIAVSSEDAGAYTIRDILENDENVTAEERQVRLWRFDQLVRHGYSDVEASSIASDPRIDLEHARRLVSELGCPPALAVRIVT
jgi:hypothetical protein